MGARSCTRSESRVWFEIGRNNPIGLLMREVTCGRVLKAVLVSLLAAWPFAISWGADRYETLKAGDVVYKDVVVRSQNASSLIVMHSRGLAQIPFKDLSNEIQERYGYSDANDQSRNADLDRIRRKQIIESKLRIEQLRKEEENARLSKNVGGADQAVQKFGIPPKLEFEVDLRPKFKELGIGIGDQGRRPSCAIYAVVGALEYLEGRRQGIAENLSEYYLYWATLKTLGRYDQSELWNNPSGSDADAGFHLQEVFQALRGYGIPNSEEAADLGRNAVSGELETPASELVQKARVRSAIKAYAVPGRDKSILLGNIVHALNAGEPVVVGMAWPHYRSIRKTAVIDSQTPRENYGHAITLVGYQSPSRRLEDITFVFRNSWGVKWGAGGYGYVRYKYIVEHLYSAFVMEGRES